MYFNFKLLPCIIQLKSLFFYSRIEKKNIDDVIAIYLSVIQAFAYVVCQKIFKGRGVLYTFVRIKY